MLSNWTKSSQCHRISDGCNYRSYLNFFLYVKCWSNGVCTKLTKTPQPFPTWSIFRHLPFWVCSPIIPFVICQILIWGYHGIQVRINSHIGNFITKDGQRSFENTCFGICISFQIYHITIFKLWWIECWMGTIGNTCKK